MGNRSFCLGWPIRTMPYFREGGARPQPLWLISLCIMLNLCQGEQVSYVAKSFAQALTSTLPPLLDGYKKLGLTQDIHFKVGGYFDKSTGVPRPHIGPLKTDHLIHFCNGSVMIIASQDRNSVADNGKSTDWGVIDEAKFIDYDRLQEEFIIPMRGNIDRFGHLWNHLSTLYCSDLPDFMDHWLHEG